MLTLLLSGNTQLCNSLQTQTLEKFFFRSFRKCPIKSCRKLITVAGDLNYGSCLKLYSEEQVDTVMEALIAIFCKRHHKVSTV